VRTFPNNILYQHTTQSRCIIVTITHTFTRSHVTTHNNIKNVKLIITRHNNNNCTVIPELLAVLYYIIIHLEMCDANVKRATFTMDHRSTVAIFIVPVFDLIILNSAANQ